MQNKKGFVVSAVLYPLLVLFLELMMGLLAMSDTRKRILDKMKLEISDSIFDDAECSCETIVNKLNYLIKNGVGEGTNSISLNVKNYETAAEFPQLKNSNNDIAIVSVTTVSNYLLASERPIVSEEGLVWIKTKELNGEYSGLGKLKTDELITSIAYIEQYQSGEWKEVEAYIWNDDKWNLLNYKTLETATAEDIVKGKTAIVNGNLVTGTVPKYNLYHIGTGTTFDIKAFCEGKNIDYKTLTVDNFIIPIGTSYLQGGYYDSPGVKIYFDAEGTLNKTKETTLVKTYDAQTGMLTISNNAIFMLLMGYYNNSWSASSYVKAIITPDVYLFLGEVK